MAIVGQHCTLPAFEIWMYAYPKSCRLLKIEGILTLFGVLAKLFPIIKTVLLRLQYKIRPTAYGTAIRCGVSVFQLSSGLFKGLAVDQQAQIEMFTVYTTTSIQSLQNAPEESYCGSSSQHAVIMWQTLYSTFMCCQADFFRGAVEREILWTLASFGVIQIAACFTWHLHVFTP